MLVLTRKHQEKIRIGDHIVITILKTKGKTVRVGIEAPAEVPVIRGELSFVGEPVEWPADASGEEADRNQAIRDEPLPRRASQASAERVGDNWPKKSDVRPTSTHLREGAPTQVTLQRMSRTQVSQALPKLVSGRGPLSAMLDRRSVSA